MLVHEKYTRTANFSVLEITQINLRSMFKLIIVQHDEFREPDSPKINRSLILDLDIFR